MVLDEKGLGSYGKVIFNKKKSYGKIMSTKVDSCGFAFTVLVSLLIIVVQSNIMPYIHIDILTQTNLLKCLTRVRFNQENRNMHLSVFRRILYAFTPCLSYTIIQGNINYYGVHSESHKNSKLCNSIIFLESFRETTLI